MRRTSVAILAGAIAAAILPSAASAVAIVYVVDRSLSPSQEGGTLTVVGTVTVDDTGPTVTDWDITVTSTALARSFTLDPSNSLFVSSNTTLTPTPTQLTIDTGVLGIWGPQLRDNATTLRHEWFLSEEQGFVEQASLDFADPDPDSDFFSVRPRPNPTILLAVPEPATLSSLALALAGLAAIGGRRRR
jgi:PEP-CTERM motif